ncbi:ABC transporter ATP-binding protein [Alginatibacterium sediminis]|uniref:ATP-binding protein Uup n=1 Tax=Alginatibacterium sediminis TaxID=2164068 RepID=A0A420EGV0_9ALTE|nr:ABC transporter ATP-binding protein [Alginatibacterium sediminis]RKF19919.1 ABC transporter ATP-binding protein [Alginatibacterium sediminis]
MLINLQDAFLAYGDTPLLKNADFQVDAKERLCLVGRNGAGKSSLMKVLAQEIQLDSGKLQLVNNTVVARLQQDPPTASEATVYQYVAQGSPKVGKVLSDYHLIMDEYALDPRDDLLEKMGHLQEQIETLDGWNFDSQIQRVISLLSLDKDASLTDLSGGWLRKVALAQALVMQPDVLLLDEPTNHLDIKTIQWLEEFLKTFGGTIVFVSHDRQFIRNVATRIVDIDRGVFTSWPGNYDQYLEGKIEWLRVEELQNAQFDKKLAEEEVWIRQGIKARRTRNEGRVRALKALRVERSDRVKAQGQSQMSVDSGLKSGKVVFEAEQISFRYDAQTPIVEPIDLLVMRGDKIALVGPNGCGKSTLIKMLLGQLEPSGGTIKTGTNLEVAYFDQYRQEVDPEKTLLENIAGGRQMVEVGGKTKHVMGYLQDFLFHPKRAFTPVKALSGGEKNRLLLAKLFLKPANILVLDEPTNDLDVETLELLEELISDYKGTVLLVSHDRSFIDNTATALWNFTGHGKISIHHGGYQELERVQRIAEASAKPSAKSEPKKSTTAPVAQKIKRSKMSFKLKHELDEMPKALEKAEALVDSLQSIAGASDFYSKSQDFVQEHLEKLADAEHKLEQKLERWEELEAIKLDSET